MTKTVYWGQIPGRRDYQEDYAIIRGGDDPDDGCMMLVCDGMGGHAAGDVASKTAARAFLATFNENRAADPADWMPQALTAGNDAIADAIRQNESLRDMGTTLLACAVSGDDVAWISVGDSLLFHVRKSAVTVLNDDHSMVPVLEQLVKDGQISEEDALADPRRNALRSAVMGDDIPLVDLQEETAALKPGDVLILASDGLLSLDGSEVGRLTSQSRSDGAKAIADALLNAVDSLDLPHQDNTTVVVYVHRPDEAKGFFASLFGR
jgi:serine/threonine protein phosphatase PrpC